MIRKNQKELNKTIWLENLSWTMANNELKGDKPIIIPIGAISKEHGPHLPLNTDYLIAKEMVTRLGTLKSVISTAIIGFGFYPAFEKYPGTISIDHDTFISIVLSIIKGLVEAGSSNLIIFNTGVSTTPELLKVIRKSYLDYNINVGLVNIEDLYRDASNNLSLSHPLTHADFMETSLVMAINKKLVRIGAIKGIKGKIINRKHSVIKYPLQLDPFEKNSPSYNPTGVLGDPSGANSEIGNIVMNKMVELFSAAIFKGVT